MKIIRTNLNGRNAVQISKSELEKFWADCKQLVMTEAEFAKMIRLAMDRRSKISQNFFNSFPTADDRDYANMMKKLIDASGFDVNSIISENDSANLMCTALRNGSVADVEMLIACGFDNSCLVNGASILTVADFEDVQNRKEKIDVLKKSGINMFNLENNPELYIPKNSLEEKLKKIYCNQPLKEKWLDFLSSKTRRTIEVSWENLQKISDEKMIATFGEFFSINPEIANAKFNKLIADNVHLFSKIEIEDMKAHNPYDSVFKTEEIKIVNLKQERSL